MKKTIILTIAGTEFSFNMSTNDYNNYMNDLMPDNKTGPAHNLVMRTIESTQKEDLKTVLETSPSAALQIAGLLNQEFAPSIEISVKK